MKIGIAAENRPLEKRVIMHPEELRTIAARHEVLVERGAGLGVGILDAEYESSGCAIAARAQVYACELVVRIKEPNADEIRLLNRGAMLMSMMHLNCAPKLESLLAQRDITAIPLESLKDNLGRRLVEAVRDTGRIGMEYGFKLWGKDPAKARVKIMGYGNVAEGAIRAALEKLAAVEILNRRHFDHLERYLAGTDILVDAVNRPYHRELDKEPPLVSAKMLKLFKPGSVLVDLISTPANHAGIETMRPTYLKEPYYMVDGIYHTSLWGWPAMDPFNVSKRYSMQLAPILRKLANAGLENAPPVIQNAVCRLGQKPPKSGA